jgi:hypothetical protein
MKPSTWARIAGATTLSIVLPLLAAEKLAVKTGLWESTVVMQIGGISIPAGQLEKVPPAQRAQMEQMLKQMGVGAPRTITEQSCVTDKDLEQNAFGKALEQDLQDCEYQQVANSSRRQEITFQCKTPGGDATGRIVVEVASDSRVRGTMEARMPQGSMDATFEAKWLAAGCTEAG